MTPQANPFKRSSTALAVGVSVLVHIAIVLGLQYSKVLTWEPLTKSFEQVADGERVTAVLMDAAPLQRTPSSKSAAIDGQMTAQDYSGTKPTAVTQQKPVLTPLEQPQASQSPLPAKTEPNDTEIFPHEELAKKKPIIPDGANPKPAQYSLPNKVKLKYEGAWGATPVHGVLTLATNSDDYEASLTLNASILFKSIEIKQTVQGKINENGLDPLRAEDKGANGSTVAMTVNPVEKFVVISRKEGMQTYIPGGKDLLSLILQLGVLVQAQPEWKNKGSTQEFTVYRPSGIKRWRYQSQGMDMLQLPVGVLETVYVKRIPLTGAAEPDFEYVHHFWLDPARHGLPVRIKLEDVKNNRTIEVSLVQWEES